MYFLKGKMVLWIIFFQTLRYLERVWYPVSLSPFHCLQLSLCQFLSLCVLPYKSKCQTCICVTVYIHVEILNSQCCWWGLVLAEIWGITSGPAHAVYDIKILASENGVNVIVFITCKASSHILKILCWYQSYDQWYNIKWVPVYHYCVWIFNKWLVLISGIVLLHSQLWFTS